MYKLKELIIELTDKCPQMCRHCSTCSAPMCSNQLPKNVVKKILDEGVLLHAEKVCFGGGEPTISKLFGWTLSEVSRTGIESEVFSCGLNLDDTNKPIPFTQDIVDSLVLSKEYVTIVFSIHGHNREMHDYVTQVPGSFDMMMQSIRTCMSKGIHCVANCVPTKLNYQYLDKIVSLVRSLGMSKLSLLRFVPQGRGKVFEGELLLSSSEEEQFVHNLMDIRERTDLDIRTGSPFNGIVPDSFTPCRAAISKLVIQADGNVIPCEVFKDSRRKDWGVSVYSHSLQEILDSVSFAELREELIGNHCAECPVHSQLRKTRSGELINVQYI